MKQDKYVVNFMSSNAVTIFKAFVLFVKLDVKSNEQVSCPFGKTNVKSRGTEHHDKIFCKVSEKWCHYILTRFPVRFVRWTSSQKEQGNRATIL